MQILLILLSFDGSWIFFPDPGFKSSNLNLNITFRMIRFYKYLPALFIIMLGFNNLDEILAQNGNDFVFERITSENIILQKGLSQNTIYCLMEDRQGYMWFGTWDGLNKYDGYNFTIYNKQNGLSNETINAILEDELGRIWIGTENGLNCLNRKTGKITVYKSIAADSTTLSGNWINHLYQDKPGQLIICTTHGINTFDFNSGTIKRYQNGERGIRNLRSNWINYIFCDSEGKYWAGSNFGLVRYDPITHENIRFLNRPGDYESLSSNVVNVIFEDKNHQIWVGTDNGLNLIDENEGKFKVYATNPENPGTLGNSNIRDIFEDSQGNFWIATDGGGLNILDRKTDKFSRIENQPKNPNSLGNNRVYSICEDRDGNLWFGTFKGVSKIEKHTNKFNLFTHEPDNPNSIVDNYIWTFCEVEPNVFWIGTDDGISIFDKRLNSFNFIKRNPNSKNTLSSSRVRCILKDSSGDFWIGLRDAGLDKFEPSKGKYTNFKPSIQDINSICDLYVTTLFEDSHGLIWAGTNNGINLINPQTNQIRAFHQLPGDSSSTHNNSVYGIAEDKNGTIWLATGRGLCKYNRDNDTFSVFLNKSQGETNTISDKLFCVFIDSKQDIWIGTRGGGIEKFNQLDSSFTSFTTDDGLPNNVVYGILEDEQQNLWLSTNWGLSRFNRNDNTFINYDVTDGIQSNEFNSGAFLKSKDGEMFFGGMRGFNSFFPKDIKSNTAKPEIAITAFKKFNLIQPGELHNGDTIILGYDENFFSFGFSALDFTNPTKNRYSYKLDNYNDQWTNVDGQRHFAEYTKVSPGTYTFRVVGSNNNGVWNNEGVAITIIITPPWFGTWFFRIGTLILLLVAIYLSVFFRIKNIRKKHAVDKKMLQIEKQLFEIQQKALRLQMNPHFIFNSLNSIQSFVLSKDIDLAVNYLGRFSHLMRLILNNSAESIIPLADELKAVKYYLEIEKLRFDDKFSYTIIIDPQIDEEFTGIPPMIIQPYIENAIIHGLVHKESEGHITVEFKKQDNLILCTIQDDGIGRQQAMEIKKQSGLDTRAKGMLITKERLEILNQNLNQKFSVKVTDLTDNEGNSTGTKVELVILFQEI